MARYVLIINSETQVGLLCCKRCLSAAHTEDALQLAGFLLLKVEGVLQPGDLLSSCKDWEAVHMGQHGIGCLQQVPGVVGPGRGSQHVQVDALAVL